MTVANISEKIIFNELLKILHIELYFLSETPKNMN